MKKIRIYFRAMKHYFISSFLLLSIITLTSCFEPATHEVLPVPYFAQRFLGWCGTACVQMWSHYDGYNPTQQTIALQSGWLGTNAELIATAVGMWTNSNGVGWPYGSSNEQQDFAISAQVASMNGGVPSISILFHGTHAGIVIGWDWTESGLKPIANELNYHDPQTGPNIWKTVKRWKQSYFTAFGGNHWIVIGYKRFVPEGKQGYAEFLARGGTYYGAPEDYGDPEEPEE